MTTKQATLEQKFKEEKTSVILNFDGSCTDTKRDGDLGIGVHAQFQGDALGSIFQISESVGIGTNNEAEYLALIRGLEELINMNLTGNLIVIGDSELVIKQMTGEYKCRDIFLRRLNMKAKQLCSKFKSVEFKHVHREKNYLADELSKKSVNRTLVDYYNYRF